MRFHARRDGQVMRRFGFLRSLIAFSAFIGFALTPNPAFGQHGGHGGGGFHGGGGGGGFHGGGGGFHGGGGGFHGGGMHAGGGFHGGGGFRGGGGMHAAGAPRGGGFHAIHPAPSARMGASAGRFQGHPAGSFAGGNGRGGIHGGA